METSIVGIVTLFSIHGNKYYNDHSTVNFNTTSHTKICFLLTRTNSILRTKGKNQIKNP